MPSYTLKCQVCNHNDNLLMTYREAQEHECTICQGPTKLVIIGLAGVKGPTRKFHEPERADDPGFIREWDSVMSDDD